jgi:hypothetical protein
VDITGVDIICVNRSSEQDGVACVMELHILEGGGAERKNTKLRVQFKYCVTFA